MALNSVNQPVIVEGILKQSFLTVSGRKVFHESRN